MENNESNVRIDRVVTRVDEQAQLEGRIELEEGQSDIARVISTTASLVPENVRVLDDAVEFSGKVVFEVMYVTVDAPDDVAVIEAQSNFNHTMQAPGAKNGMRTAFIGRVDDVEEVLESPRSVALTADVDLAAWIIANEEIEPIDQSQNVQLQTENYVGVETLESQTVTQQVDQQVEIPPRSLPVGKIVSNSAFAVVRDVTGTVEGTHVDGDLIVFTNYFSQPDETRPTPVLQTYSYVIPLSVDLEWEQRGAGENAQVVMVVDSIDVTPVADEMGENRLLDVEARVLVNAELWQERDFSVAADAYVPGHEYSVETAAMQVRMAPQHRHTQRMLRFAVTLPGGYPPMQQTQCLRARPVIRSVIQQQDAALAVGTLECDVVYRSTQEDAPVYGFHASIPFEERIASECQVQDMMLRAWCEQTSCAVLSPSEAECRVQLEMEAVCMPVQQINMVTGVQDEGPLRTPQSAIVMTVAGAQDDLWQIAKRFGVSVEEVVAANPQYRTQSLKNGDKLLLYRRARA